MASLGFFDPGSGDPWGGLDSLRREMDAAFERVGTSTRRLARGTPYPAVNLYESDAGYVVTAEVPGLASSDFEVSVEGNRVTLRGERKVEYPDDGQTSIHRRERQSGIFRRSVELPVPLDSDKAEAVYRNGVLMLRVPKAPSHQPRQITVQTS